MNEWLGLVCYLVVVGLSLRRYYGLRRRTRRIRIGGGVMTLDRPAMTARRCCRERPVDGSGG
jgi:hypothetical protein